MITCIMPTMLRRRKLLPAAFKMFADQTYKQSRLLIGIDEEDRELLIYCADLARAYDLVGRVEFLVGDWPTLGAKRNSMCEAANTPWIAFWDDDDWHAPYRLELTMATIVDGRVRAYRWKPNEGDLSELPMDLSRTQIEPDVVGSRSMLIHEILAPTRRTWVYQYRGVDPYFIGGLLAFRRRVWNEQRFDEDQLAGSKGEDAWWILRVLKAGFPFVELFDTCHYCAFMHGSNTANTQYPNADPNWKPAHGNIVDVIGRDDLVMWEDAHRAMEAERVALFQSRLHQTSTDPCSPMKPHEWENGACRHCGIGRATLFEQ